MVRLDRETDTIERQLGETRKELVGRFEDASTVLANEVAVPLRSEVIDGRSVSKVDMLDHSETLELVQVAIDGREVNIRSCRLRGGGQILGGAMTATIEEALE